MGETLLGLEKIPDVRVTPAKVLGDGAGVVLRVVIDHDHFIFRYRQRLFTERLQTLGEQLCPIIGANHDTDCRPRMRDRLAKCFPWLLSLV